MDYHANIRETDSLVGDALQLIEESAEKALAARGRFRLSLCGGSTPRPIYEALARSTGLDWSKVQLTFGDERCVPPGHERSNYRMVEEALLTKVPLPGNQILRMEGERPPDEAAAGYEAALKKTADQYDEPIYRHDLILLGMGDDGHTASLFPGTTALEETKRWVVANEVPKFEEFRLTMTYPLLNAARHVCFLVSGETKRPVYERIFSGNDQAPAAKVLPVAGELTWIIA